MTRVDAASATGGVLLVDKSPGPTSHDVVAAARRTLGIRRVGHTGTLDPFASGLLVLCVGRATRLSEYFHLPAKRYEAEVRLGVETDSHDREGRIVAESEAWRDLSADEVQRAVARLEGPIMQRPPAFSAKRMAGRRAHELARAGAAVALPVVPVRVHALRLLALDPPVLRLAVRVSAGTYVRSLARDLGRELGCGAHLAALRRVAIGELSVRDALPDEKLKEEPTSAHRILETHAWLEPGAAMPWLPLRHLTDEELAHVAAGRRLAAGEVVPAGSAEEEIAAAGPVRLLHGGRLVAVAEWRGGELRPRKVFVD